jgi:hypothetical protein
VDVGYKIAQRDVSGIPSSGKYFGIKPDANYTKIQIDLTHSAFSSNAQLFVNEFLGYDRNMIIHLNGKLITKSTDTVYLEQSKNSQVEVCVMKDSGDFSSIVLH